MILFKYILESFSVYAHCDTARPRTRVTYGRRKSELYCICGALRNVLFTVI